MGKHDPMAFMKFVQPIEDDLHRARHFTVQFEPDEHPALDLGWNIGVLFGIHLAVTYPEICYKVDKTLFNLEEQNGPNLGADVVAEAISVHHFPKAPLEDTALLDKWVALAEKRREDETVATERPEDMWPLPNDWNGWGWTQ